MRNIKIVILIVSVFVITTSVCAQKRVDKVIFMIGDGMGLNQIFASLTINGSLNMVSCPYSGFVKTDSSDDYRTDSAAAGTAISTGFKTKNGMVGMSKDTIPLVSIMENAKNNGFATGIVVTCSVTHATPAAFYAHQSNREFQENIAKDFVNSCVDVCIGGGRKFFIDRDDNKDLTINLLEKGFKVIYNQNDIIDLESGKVIALLADEHLPKMSEGRGDYLSESTAKAIQILDNNSKKGFFLMIEGSQIDWGGHKNDQEYMIEEILDFDKAVRTALNYANRDKHTLVIITADHETGGMSLAEGNIARKEVKTVFTTKGHSASPVPVFAFGPGAENFTGFFDNTEFKNKIEKLLNF
jgi:alkaline phosphatase